MKAGPSIRELIPTHASSLLAAACLLGALIITASDPGPQKDNFVEQAPPMINVGELDVGEASSDIASYSPNETAGCMASGSAIELACADSQTPETTTIDLEPVAEPDAT